jgi:hypothetical protein
MISNFFLLGGRTYLNNAIVTADVLSVVADIFGDTIDFNIKFKKPFNSQAELKFSTEPLDGHTVGSFLTKLTKFYFSYTPIDVTLPTKIIDPDEVNYFNLIWSITDAGRTSVRCKAAFCPAPNRSSSSAKALVGASGASAKREVPRSVSLMGTSVPAAARSLCARRQSQSILAQSQCL